MDGFCLDLVVNLSTIIGTFKTESQDGLKT